MLWKNKLSKKQLKHVGETTQRTTLTEFKNNLASQTKTGLVCWDCRAIAHKLNVPVEATNG